MNKYILCICLFFVSCSGFPQAADLVLLNGKIITLKEPGNTAGAVAIKADKIIAVGSTQGIRKFINDKTKVIDLEHHTVIPGFNDVHQHPAPVYSWDKAYASLRLDTVSSMESLIDLLRRKAAITPKGMLITGVGYNEVKLGGHPIRDSIDKASKDHPILISHASGHLSAANSYMLEINGINKDTQSCIHLSQAGKNS
jgi:predicted amidohydrolase YtcJ